MRRILNNLNADIVQNLPAGEEYVARVTSDEGSIGRGFLSKFQDPEEPYPVILTTSQMLMVPNFGQFKSRSMSLTR